MISVFLRHPEVPARSAGLEGCTAKIFQNLAVALRGSPLRGSHLRVTDQAKAIRN
jgi:hypothetical protein